MGRLTTRAETRQVICGGVAIGGGAPVAIQSMTNTFTEDAAATAAQARALYDAGADIVRIAVPSMEAARAIPEIRARLEAGGGRDDAGAQCGALDFDASQDLRRVRRGATERLAAASQSSASASLSETPCSASRLRRSTRSPGSDSQGTDRRTALVADIHFDYKLAIAAIEAGADKVRINPGNIGGAERVKAVVDAAGAAGVPIRIGVNGGSLEDDLKGLHDVGRPAEALAESALRNIDLVRGMGFDALVVSIKSSDVMVNTEAHKLLAAATDVPLHIGITEAGYGSAGLAKSAVGIGALLAMGIGDTIRVSLTGDPVQEVAAARDILRAVNLLPGGITLVSCPTCGRCRVDLAALCEEVSAALAEAERGRIRAAAPITVALMGCAVNGPGEASGADFGVACGADGGVFFEKGARGESVPLDKIVETILAALEK
ncbi:MAG: flavodoxin-dependent (E)-4-hydroxy-3-methylbut-2-enyl-diphosphate synthase [Clostridiales bacterium]|nr:flavodoxin-dependent (E)-4-hydroxy-3-methylbut-2-enyl-diphosphate synthase [Clostridiales bacterium]